MVQTIFGNVFEKSWKMKRIICGFMIARLADYSTKMDKRQKEFSASFKTQSIN